MRRAERAQTAYEAGVRTFAPLHSSPESDHRCDEYVGRYCLIYDSGDEKLPPEPDRIRFARDSAIAALRRASSLAPRSISIARSLVLDLVRAGHSAQAVETARAYARARSSPDADMLLGFALHHDRQTTAALEAFSRWLQSLRVERRAKVLGSDDWLLDPAARKRRRSLQPTQWTREDSLLWRFADPLYLTPGNELLADHLARNALAAMKLEMPRVWNADTWGEDSRQLLVRFGEPARTTKSAATTSIIGGSPAYSEHWDPDERTYFPPSQASIGLEARLDTIWPLDSLTAHSGHAPPTIRIMKVLEHQAAVFGGRQVSYLIAGMAVTDSAVRRTGLVGALFLLDSTLAVIRRVPAEIDVRDDSVTFRARTPLPSLARFYSAEVYDTISRYAARARYPLATIDSDAHTVLSGLLLSNPDAPAQPLTRPVVVSGSRFGIYAEVTGSSGPLRLALETRSLDRPGVPVRVGRWLGRRLGLESGARAPALGWSAELKGDEPMVVALTVDVGDLKPGHYVVRLSVKRDGGGKTLVAERRFLVSGR